MGKNEGFRRIFLIGKLFMLIGVTRGAISWLIGGVPFGLIGATIGLYVVAIGGIVWAAGWIVQGFIRPDP
jgi:hypothetical protein